MVTGVDYEALERQNKLMSDLFTKKSDGWYRGCGCGQKAGDKVFAPDGTVELFVQHNGALEGPSTGIPYNFVPNTTAIDVDPRDAAAWRIQGIARDPMPGFKGRFARIENEQVQTPTS